MAEGGHIPFDLGARNRAGDDGVDDGMAEGKLPRRGGKRNTMARADRLDFLHPLEDLGAGRGVIVHRARNGAGREDSGIVAAADDDPDAAFLAAWKLALEHILLEQGVAHRQQEKVHVEQIEEVRNGAHRVEARAEPAYSAW